MTREEIVAEARSWLGTKWLHQGRLKGKGVDCIGLVYMTAVSLGMVRDVVLPPYERRVTDNVMLMLCNKHLLRRSTPAAACVVTMRFEGEARHMGILADYPHGGFSIIHSYAVARKVIEHRLDSLWQSRITGYFDFREVA